LRADINGKGRHDGQRHAKGRADERRAGHERDAGARSTERAQSLRARAIAAAGAVQNRLHRGIPT